MNELESNVPSPYEEEDEQQNFDERMRQAFQDSQDADAKAYGSGSPGYFERINSQPRLAKEREEEFNKITQPTNAKADEGEGQMEREPKKQIDIKDPKKFGFKENTEDLVNASVAGLQDAWNNTVTLGKFFDPNFYKGQEAGEYEYEGPGSGLQIEQSNLPKTVWGKFLRNAIDVGVGFVGFGKFGTAIKGATTLVKGAKVANTVQKGTRVSRALTGLKTGAATTLWDLDSDSSNFSQYAAEWQPQLFAWNPIKTNDEMSPFQRSTLNMVEGLGLDAAFGLVFTGKGNTSRVISNKLGDEDTAIAKKAAELTPQAPPSMVEKNKELSKLEYKKLSKELNKEARKKFKNFNKYPPEQQNEILQQLAYKRNVMWGDERNIGLKNKERGEVQTEVGVDQLEADLKIGQPRENPAYTPDSSPVENQFSSKGVAKDPNTAVREQVFMNSDWESSSFSSNSGVVTDAHVRRLSEASNGELSVKEAKERAEALVTEGSLFSEIFEGPTRQQTADTFMDINERLMMFLSETGNSRSIDLSPDEQFRFLKSLGGETPDSIEGVTTMNMAQIAAVDILQSQLLQSMRDISRASLSISDQINTTAPGGLFDRLMDNYKALAMERGTTSAASSYALRRFQASTETAVEETLKQKIAKKRAVVEQEVQTVTKILKENPEMLEAFQYFVAASDGSAATFRDMEAFFRRNAFGFSDKKKYNQNMLLKEMSTMGINSMLSGPRTITSVGFSTAISMFTKPIATIVGSGITGDYKTLRAEGSALGGMLRGIPEAMKKARADFSTYLTDGVTLKGEVISTPQQKKFQATYDYFMQNGTKGEKLYMGFVNWLNNVNGWSITNYGPRLMAATDSFAGTIIARGRAAQNAFLTVEDQIIAAKNNLPDSFDRKQLIKEAENKFRRDIWTKDGKLSDPMAQVDWDEAGMKADLSLRMAQFDSFMKKVPILRPFMGLFIKTQANAFKLGIKNIPLINGLRREVRDIYTKPWNDEVMKTYGIFDPQDLARRQAEMNGRNAIATGVIMTAAGLYFDGRLTGTGPRDFAERKFQREQKVQFSSIKFGEGKDAYYVSFNVLEPYNTILNMVADIGDNIDVIGEDNAGEYLQALVAVVSGNLGAKSFAGGIQQLTDLAGSNFASSEAIAANLLNNQVPLSSLRKSIGDSFVLQMKELNDSFWDTVKKRNPYLAIGDFNKVDLINGKSFYKFQDPLSWSANTLSRINIGPVPSAGKMLMIRGNFALADSFNSFGNIDLSRDNELRSAWHNKIAEQNIDQKIIDAVNNNPKILESIVQMEADPSLFDSPMKFGHNREFKRIVEKAKENAWNTLLSESDRAKQYQRLDDLKKLKDKTYNNPELTESMNKRIEPLEKLLRN